MLLAKIENLLGCLTAARMIAYWRDEIETLIKDDVEPNVLDTAFNNLEEEIYDFQFYSHRSN